MRNELRLKPLALSEPMLRRLVELKTNRRQLQLAIDALAAGDVLLVTRLEIKKRLAQRARYDLRERRGV